MTNFTDPGTKLAIPHAIITVEQKKCKRRIVNPVSTVHNITKKIKQKKKRENPKLTLQSSRNFIVFLFSEDKKFRALPPFQAQQS